MKRERSFGPERLVSKRLNTWHMSRMLWALSRAASPPPCCSSMARKSAKSMLPERLVS
jgi:hypothetical protein